MKNTHFTLIEMLVVIAIISILASLLMPALYSAQETARGITCRNNTKSIIAGVMLYSNDYNGFITPSCCGTYRPWNFLLIPYLMSGFKIANGGYLYYENGTSTKKGFMKNTAFCCPSSEWIQTQPFFLSSSFYANYRTSYGVIYNAGYHNGLVLAVPFKKFSRVYRPSEKVYVTEGDVSWRSTPSSRGATLTHNSNVSDIELRDVMTSVNQQMSWDIAGPSAYANSGFLDGHVNGANSELLNSTRSGTYSGSTVVSDIPYYEYWQSPTKEIERH